ncbi:MAG TPA: BREX system serine/threonine kinase PglW [Pirellulales bacterium]|nr:BREX system serine/threonine kinase PglW [Pirellulales bacterium]
MSNARNWTTMTESKFPWEREALDFIRQRFPSHEPYRAWSNFEFIADDGSINEVDLLVFTPQGLYLVEIKSRPGRLTGDAGTWTWENEGRRSTLDNPLIATNFKAKKLRSLLQRQRLLQKKAPLPFIEALVFCSDANLLCELEGNARFRICLRDREAVGETQARPGIMAALQRRECPGLEPRPKGIHDRPMAKLVSQAMDQAGIRPSQRHRKVSDYVLEQLVCEGPGYQDWQATHTQVAESKRRVRLYLVRAGATVEDRKTIENAALREFKLLETLQHPSILRAHGFTEHEVGPALLFEYDPRSLRLDHFLAQQKDALSIDARLDLVRQIADVVRYAHDKKVVHRSLCPQSVLVTDAGNDSRRIKVFNWQAGYRESTSSSGVSGAVTPTSHIDRLVEDASTAYMAPEAFSDESPGEHLDVFSLGAIAYHIFSGQPPASGGLELNDKLRESKGLRISSVLNGAGEWLQLMIQKATHPVVGDRTDSVLEFLSELDEVENELSLPEHEYAGDPPRAQIGDLLPGGFRVLRRLGQGASSVALLVERDGQDFVLKVSNDPEHDARVKDEAEVLGKVRHPHVVEFVDLLELGDRTGFLMRPVFAEKDKKLIETLGQRLRKEGRLQIDLLQRFGEDLLGVVCHLEEQGISHRDIKPDNIAVGMVGRGDKLHLVLFDFSLSRTPADNTRAGTKDYLDPLLPLRKPLPRWDLHAERYAAAVTLYELATGAMPKWGDGTSDPSHLSPTTEITVDAEQFDPGLRDRLIGFFRKAFRRDVAQRFDNGEEMLRAWRHSFEGIDEPGPLSDHADETLLAELLAEATFDTPISEMGLGTRASNVLDRANVLTVEDLLTVPIRRLLGLRGVGHKTRREIAGAVKILRERLGKPAQEADEADPAADEAEPQVDTVDVRAMSVDLLASRVYKAGAREGDTVRDTAQALLGLAPQLPGSWPSQSDVARLTSVTRARTGQIVAKLQGRWMKDRALTQLRGDLAAILSAQGGVMTAAEMADAVLVARGSVQDEPERSRLASAVVRAAVEAERSMAESRMIARRDEDRIFIACTAELAGYAQRLGDLADAMAVEDPLVSPARVVERLRDVAAPANTALPDARLVRLAAAASCQAAVSSRQELYPRDMPALRALKLSQGALLGVPLLSVDEIHQRVGSRYPRAAALPPHPALEGLLREAGFGFQWDPLGKGGLGCYVSPPPDRASVSSGSQPVERLPTSSSPGEAGDVTPEQADARQFEERLQRAVKEGAFLSLLVHRKDFDLAREVLCRRFPLELVDFEGLFLDSLRDVAGKANVNWELVLKTDAAPHDSDWDKLMMLVGRAMPAVERRLMAAERTMLVIYAGLLARYEQMDLLSRLSEKVGRRDGIPGLWLLIPNPFVPLLDGKPVPLIGPAQRARIPDSWLQNRHRGRQS